MQDLDATTATGEEPVSPPSAPPPGMEGGLGGLLRDNLLKDPRNTAITLVFGLVGLYVLYRAGTFVLLNEKPTPDGGTVNAWRVVRDELVFYMVGTEFQNTQIGFGRLWAAIFTVALAAGLATGGDAAARGQVGRSARVSTVAPLVLGAVVLLGMTTTILPTVLTAATVAIFLLARRLAGRLPEAVASRRTLLLLALALIALWLETGFSTSVVDQFGGLLLTVNVAFIAILLCFPIGVVLALTRRSDMLLLKPLAILYIELIRGVPLITLLFIGQFALAFFLPPSADAPAPVIRSIIMITLFSAAYVAEIVRGGLQSVPKGQTEAGQAIGLSPLTITGRIVLPQALRNSIPPLVGQFISLLKDTTLLVIISQFDLLGVGRRIVTSNEYANQGYAAEVYAFVALLFWIICFSMSRASQRLETRLGVGQR